MIPDLKSLILLLGTAHGLYLIFVSLSSARDSPSNFFLAVILFAFSYDSFCGFLFTSGYMGRVHFLMGTSMPWQFLVGPAFYLYGDFKLSSRESLKKTDFLHLLPAVMATVIAFPYYLKTGPEKLKYINDASMILPLERAWYMVAQWVVTVIYLLWVLKNLHSSRSKGVSFKWISNLTKVLWMLTLSYGLFIPLLFGLVAYQNAIRVVVLIITSIFIHVIGFMMIRKSPVLSEIGKRPQQLDREQTQEIKRKILEVMTQGQPWLKSDFSLKELSQAINSNSLYTSTVLNQEFGLNFTAMVNGYRIEYAKQMLLEHDDKLLAVAMNSGFSNKNSFNRAFKKATGLTPSAYRKKG